MENDGFDLGAQRSTIDRNDLPQVKQALKEYLKSDAPDTALPELERLIEIGAALVVDKEKISGDGEYNLNGEQYRDIASIATQYEWVNLGDVALGKPQYGSGAKKVPYDGNVRYVRITDINDQGELKENEIVSPSIIEPKYFLEEGDLLVARSGSVGRTYLHSLHEGTYQFAGYLIRFQIDPCQAIPSYVYHMTNSPNWQEWIQANSKTGTLTNINAKQYSSFRLPLPPLEVQQEIAAEIAGYQKVIDGARAVVENYRPHIVVDQTWPMIALGQKGVFSVINGGTPKSGVTEYWDGGVPWITLVDLPQDNFITEIHTTQRTISNEGLRQSSAKMIPANSVVVSSRATIGRIGINRISLSTNQGFKNIVIEDASRAIPEYVAVALSKIVPDMEAQASGATYKEITKSRFSQLRIPLPPLSVQQEIVAEIEGERALVRANRELIERFEKKIESAIARVWREDASALAEA